MAYFRHWTAFNCRIFVILKNFFFSSKDNKSQSISGKPRPPPISITNPVTTNVITLTEPRNDPLPGQSAKPTIQKLSELVQMLDITDTQKDKLEEFLKSRENIGDLTNEDLSVEGELGSGNGGVVLKVRHRKTGTAMAKKVNRIFSLLSSRVLFQFEFATAHSSRGKARSKEPDLARAHRAPWVQFAIYSGLLRRVQ